MSNLDQKRAYLREQNQKGLVRINNRAYIQKDIVLLRDYIAEEIAKIEYKFKGSKYRVEPINIDKITEFVFKPKNKLIEKERELNELWEENTSLALLPPDIVIDKSSKFAYQYNYKSKISNKYFLLDSYGINVNKDVEDNKKARPKEYRTGQSVYAVKTIRNKVRVIRYYYKGKQITKEQAYQRVRLLKENVEEIIYVYRNKLRRVFINTDTDKRILKKNAYKDTIRLKRGVKRIQSYVLGKKVSIRVRKTKIENIKYKKVNFFAQTYKNYLPYFLFLRLVKKEVKADRKRGIKKHIEEVIKFYISTYIDKNGNAKYISSLMKNGHDIIANSDMVGNVVMPQLVKSNIIQNLVKDDNRIRLKTNTDSAYIDQPIAFLFFVGQQNFLKKKKYRQSRQDIFRYDVKDDIDTGKMKDRSSLDINENKDYLVDIKDGEELKKEQKKISIESILNNNEEYINIVKRIYKLKEQLTLEKEILLYLRRRNIKRLTINNLRKVISSLNNSIKATNIRIEYSVDNRAREDLIKEKMFYENLKNDIEYIDNEPTKREQIKLIDEFNNKEIIVNSLEKKISKLNLKRLDIERREKKKIQLEEDSKIDNIDDNINGKVNLLKRYYNRIVNEINKDNPIEIRGQ